MILELERNSVGSVSCRLSLLKMVEARVRESTHNRIRNLSVEDIQGRFVVGGQVASHHMKQLALHGALELLSSEQFASEIVVKAIVPSHSIQG